MSDARERLRALALALPEAEELPHFEKASFRVKGKIFATLPADGPFAVLKLSLEEQDALSRAAPALFQVTPWGHQGWTRVDLEGVEPKLLEQLLRGAWARVAPKRLVAAHTSPAVEPKPRATRKRPAKAAKR